MDFSAISKFLREKGLFIDVIFYISISLLISSVLCYLIFLAKISSQKINIAKIQEDLQKVGTQEQKERESEVFLYQKKISDYGRLLENRKSALNVFNFFEDQTMPEVWFSRISLSERDNSVILTGEAGNMEVLSRQISNFEKNEFVEKITIMNSSVSDSGKIKFNLTLGLREKLFIPFVSQTYGNQ